MEVMYDKVLERLVKLEELLGASNKKPKMIEDVEATVSELRAQEALDVASLNGALTRIENQQDEANQTMEEHSITMAAMSKALDLRQKQIQECANDNLR
jgi:chromosome segregation ATPase